MSDDGRIPELSGKIRAMREAAEEILRLGGEIEAVKRNTARILAGIAMLELNVCDPASLPEELP